MKTKPNGKHEVPADRPMRSVAKKRYQPAEQMDFGTAFHTDDQAPIRYETRVPPNRRHDIHYLSGYIHDATFRIDELKLRGKSLIFSLDRARWELDQGSGDLTYIHSELTISQVVSLRLELVDLRFLQKDFLRAPQMIISSLQLLEEQWEESDDEEIIIDFVFHCRLRLRVGCWYKIKLRDLAAPN